MKIIDLLNKIANGEKVPKYISYYNKKESMSMIMFPCKDNIIYRLNEDAIDLGDEVEILEEENKIPEKLKSLNNVGNVPNLVEFADKQQLNNHLLKDKLNELIDYLKSKGE